VSVFQTTEPLIHKLHDEQVIAFRTFILCFIKPEAVKEKDLISPDLIVEKNLLQNKLLFTGFGATGTLSKCNKSVCADFYTKLRRAYISCATYLQKKLPLANPFLIYVSALNPSKRGQTGTLKKLELLPTLVTNVLTKEELEYYLLEIRRYEVDDLPPFVAFEKNLRLDEWWSFVFQTKQYPCLSKLVKAIISCFHGPVVESTFSSMNYIIDPRCGRMNIKTYSAIQSVKYYLKSKNISALDYFHRSDVKHDPVMMELCKNMQTSNKRYREEKTIEKSREPDFPKQKLAKNSEQILIKTAESTALQKFQSQRVKFPIKTAEPNSKRRKVAKNSEKILIKTAESTALQNFQSQSVKTPIENTEPKSKRQKLAKNETNETNEKSSNISEKQKVAWQHFFQAQKAKKK
jgi:hypothetical protein